MPITVAKEASSVTATVTPAEVKANTDTGTISVTVTGASADRSRGCRCSTARSSVGPSWSTARPTITIGPFATTGTKAITVRYYGDDRNQGQRPRTCR